MYLYCTAISFYLQPDSYHGDDVITFLDDDSDDPDGGAQTNTDGRAPFKGAERARCEGVM